MVLTEPHCSRPRRQRRGVIRAPPNSTFDGDLEPVPEIRGPMAMTSCLPTARTRMTRFSIQTLLPESAESTRRQRPAAAIGHCRSQICTGNDRSFNREARIGRTPPAIEGAPHHGGRLTSLPNGRASVERRHRSPSPERRLRPPGPGPAPGEGSVLSAARPQAVSGPTSSSRTKVGSVTSLYGGNGQPTTLERGWRHVLDDRGWDRRVRAR